MITPLDIEKKSFPTTFRGFDRDEVYAFLKSVSQEMEGLFKEISSFKEDIIKKDKALKDYEALESSMKNILMTTQHMVEKHKKEAQQEANVIRKEASLQANKIGEAKHKVIKIHEDIADLKRIKVHYKEELRLLMENHLKMLDTLTDGAAEHELNEKIDFSRKANRMLEFKKSLQIAR
jgi:cell division initiation protein